MRGTSLLAHEISADDAGGAALSFNAVDGIAAYDQSHK